MAVVRRFEFSKIEIFDTRLLFLSVFAFPCKIINLLQIYGQRC